jgi:hypothetical protein
MIRALTLLVLAASPAIARLQVELLGPLRVRGAQPAMAGPFISRSLEFDRTVLLRSLSVRLLGADGKPDPDQSHLCHLTLADAAVMHVGPMAPQLVTLDLGTRRLEMPAGYGVRLEARHRYLLNAMLLSNDPDADRTQTFEATFDLADEGAPGAPRPLIFWMTSVRPEDSDAEPGGRYDWMVPPGRRRFERTLVMPSTMTVHALTAHLHRYASELSIVETGTKKVLWRAKVDRGADGVLTRAPSWSGVEPLVFAGGRKYTLSVDYDNTGAAPSPAMGAFYFFLEPPAP